MKLGNKNLKEKKPCPTCGDCLFVFKQSKLDAAMDLFWKFTVGAMGIAWIYWTLT